MDTTYDLFFASPSLKNEAPDVIGSALMAAFVKAFPGCTPPEPGHRLKAITPNGSCIDFDAHHFFMVCIVPIFKPKRV